jgi:Uma2 family endonuclease
MTVTPKRMSLAEFLQQPEVKPARELRNGVVSQKVAPSFPHGSLQMWFGYQVDMFAEPLELARAFTESRVVLGGDTYIPDVVVYRWERLPTDEHGELQFHATTPPDIVVEIVSPGESVRSQLDKCREYIGHGVLIALLIVPGRRTVHVLRAGSEIGPLREGDAIDVTVVLPGFEMTVSDLFSRIRARPPRRPS